jgi:hypothetical protein
MRALALALIFAAGSALADSTPPVTDGKKSPDGFVVLSNPRGVIVPESHATDFYFFRKPEIGYWTPTPADIRAFEDHAATLIPPHPELHLKADDLRTKHMRQYIGVLDKKRKWIWINFFCNSHVKDWTHEVVLVKDGGSCYFQLEYNMKTRTVENLSVNGSG